jgi:hypothetical protein
MFLENKKYSKEIFRDSMKVAAANEVSPDTFKIMFTCIQVLIEQVIRSKNLNRLDFIEGLNQLKFSNECIEDLTKLLSQQQNLHEHMQDMKQLKPMDTFQYRINISLIDSGQGATVILSLKHKGRMHTINMSLRHFHRFRLTLAIILSEIHALESKKS